MVPFSFPSKLDVSDDADVEVLTDNARLVAMEIFDNGDLDSEILEISDALPFLTKNAFGILTDLQSSKLYQYRKQTVAENSDDPWN